jgi:lamin tail-like protein
MPRRNSIAASSLMILFAAACAPAPVGPRGGPEPPPPGTPPLAPSPPADAGTTDAAAADVVDAGGKREKLPAPEAGVDAAAVDAGAPDATAADAVGGDAGVDATSARPPAAGEVVVTEALVNPAGQDTGREWIEIANRSNDALDLSNLHIADANAVDVAAPAGILAAGGRLVLGQSADPSKNGGAPITVAYGTRFGLNNDGEQIAICVGACATGVVVDSVGWQTLGAAYDGHAAVFDRAANRVCPATQPFGTGGDCGTPGGADDACPAPDGGI